VNPSSAELGPVDNPALVGLWREYVRRLGRGDEPRRLTLRNLNLSERSALADLLGLERLPGPVAQVRIDMLIEALGVPDSAALTALAVAAVGPVIDEVGPRREITDRRNRLWSDLTDELSKVEWLAEAGRSRFVAQLRSVGVGADEIDDRRRLHRRLVIVLRSLPAQSLGRAVLAAETLGDPHALDDEAPLSRLVIQAIAAGRNMAMPGGAEARRAAWQSVGVVVDEVSSNVLVLGLRVPDGHGLAGQLNTAADADEPVVITLRQLRRWPVPAHVEAGDHQAGVLVVENPSILEAAAGQAARVWPALLCSYGVPTLAVTTLLRQLGAEGADVYQHADFDPAGLVITDWLRRHAGTTPWKMTAADYDRAIESVGAGGPEIAGRIPRSPWDPDLRRALERHRTVISEEQLLSELVGDL